MSLLQLKKTKYNLYTSFKKILEENHKHINTNNLYSVELGVCLVFSFLLNYILQNFSYECELTLK